METINWGKEWLDFGFAFLATALGVLLAFELDRWRERRKDKAKKIKLIQSLLDEIEGVLDVLREHPNLTLFLNLYLQTDVIVETVNDQLELFDSQTNKFLKIIRKQLIITGEELKEWAELNKSAIGLGKYSTQEQQYTANDIRGHWQSFVTGAPNMFGLVRKELERERAETK